MRSVVIIFFALFSLPISSSASFWDHLIFEGSAVWRTADGKGELSNRPFEITRPKFSGIQVVENGVNDISVYVPYSDPWGFNTNSRNYWGLGWGVGYRVGSRWSLMLGVLTYYLNSTTYSEDWAADSLGQNATHHGTYHEESKVHIYDLEFMVEYDLQFSGLFITAGRKFTLYSHDLQGSHVYYEGNQADDQVLARSEHVGMNGSLSVGLGIARPLQPFGHVVIAGNYTITQFTAGWTLRSAIRFTI